MENRSNKNKIYIWLYQVTIFISSFLLFSIQPLIGKYILPWFGGNASLWLTAMLFYITVLFFGYFYSYYITRYFNITNQAITQILLLIAGLLFAINPNFDWKYLILPASFLKPPAGSLPTLHILLILFVSIGLPYFLLSTTSSLLQKWFYAVNAKRSPYSLYVISNTGSLLAILSYPFLIEPFFSIIQQAKYWSYFFVGYVLAFLFIAIQIIRTKHHHLPRLIQPNKTSYIPTHYMKWLLFPALSTLMLLAVTNQISQTIAPMPFLWLAPLALYLLSYIFGFSEKAYYPKKVVPVVLLISTLGSLYYYHQIFFTNIWIKTGVYLMTLFISNYICHRSLYNLRPATNKLPIFYLISSIGSVIGSLFVTIISPNIFNDYWEFPLGLLICIVLSLYLIAKKTNVFNNKRLAYAGYGITAIILLILIRPIFDDTAFEKAGNVIEKTRNFYGVTRIITDKKIGSFLNLQLWNGLIIHGMQLQGRNLKNIPTLYYSEESGVGLIINNHPKRLKKSPLKIGVIGLGAGTIAAYCNPKDKIRFYEINPQVIEWSQKYFSFIADCRKRGGFISIAEGDARLSLENELDNRNLLLYDILVIDAFTDDAIPTHLLTVQAIISYLRHLEKYGYIAFHITNTNLNLKPVILTAARVLGANVTVTRGVFSEWVIFSYAPIPIGNQIVDKTIPLWTDNYNNLFQIVKHK